MQSTVWSKRCCMLACPVTTAVVTACAAVQCACGIVAVPTGDNSAPCAQAFNAKHSLTICWKGGEPVWYRNGCRSWVYRTQDGHFFIAGENAETDAHPVEAPPNPAFDSCCGKVGGTVGVNGPIEWEDPRVIGQAHQYVFDQSKRRSFCSVM